MKLLYACSVANAFSNCQQSAFDLENASDSVGILERIRKSKLMLYCFLCRLWSVDIQSMRILLQMRILLPQPRVISVRPQVRKFVRKRVVLARRQLRALVDRRLRRGGRLRGGGLRGLVLLVLLRRRRGSLVVRVVSLGIVGLGIVGLFSLTLPCRTLPGS